MEIGFPWTKEGNELESLQAQISQEPIAMNLSCPFHSGKIQNYESRSHLTVMLMCLDLNGNKIVAFE